MRLELRWGESGAVPVRETETLLTSQGPVELVSTYRVTWRTAPEGVVVTRTPRVFETLGGRPVSPDAKALVPRHVDDLLAPGVVVAPDGAFRAFGAPAELARLEQKLRQRGEQALFAALRTAADDPAAALRARERSRELWEAWLGAWVGIDLAPGAPVDALRPAYVGLGTAVVPAHVRGEVRALFEQEGERVVRLDLRVAHVGGDFAALAAAALPSVAGAPKEDGALRARQLDLLGTFAVATGRPLTVQARTTRVFSDGAGGTRSEKDVRAFEFDWSRASASDAAARAGSGD